MKKAKSHRWIQGDEDITFRFLDGGRTEIIDNKRNDSYITSDELSYEAKRYFKVLRLNHLIAQ